ncbi:uncharacterized protein LOC114841434 [Diachasma alloeum]|uniref:Gustatory receptor n=1 Tax=Diachasma alloeum TaxID=454923 RepID=A0A4E0RM04_9HYME|nr:uncharacterized protein LOC114841434 [Diachasma alloeum]THK33159.1 gustatory receptor 10 [Diachasma alloeum]
MKNLAQHSRKKLCLFHLIFFFFKIIGLAPFAVDIPRLLEAKKEHNSPKKTFTASTIGIIHNCALIACIIYVDSQTFDSVRRDPSAQVIKLPKIIGRCLTAIGFLLSIFIWALYILRVRRIVALANELLEIDGIMFRANSLHLKFPKAIVLVSAVHFTMSGYLIAAEVSTQQTSIHVLIVFVLPSIIVSWTLVQYSLVLHMIEERIANVNRSLLEIGNIPMELAMPSLFVRKIPVTKDATAKIVSIRRVDVDLCDLCYKIRDFYAPPTLMTVTFFGASLVYSGYFLVMPFITRSDPHFHLTYINGIAWLSLQLSCLFNLTISVTKITRTIRKTVNFVHLLLDCCVLPSDASAELKGFSRQILMKKFQLSVYDMFPLDNSLLSSIAGFIITNLIILIQFST